MRDLLLLILAFLTRPVHWLMPADMTLPLILWLIAFTVAVATLVWLLRRLVRVLRNQN